MGKAKHILFIAAVAIVANAVMVRFAPAAVKNVLYGTTTTN